MTARVAVAVPAEAVEESLLAEIPVAGRAEALVVHPTVAAGTSEVVSEKVRLEETDSVFVPAAAKREKAKDSSRSISGRLMDEEAVLMIHLLVAREAGVLATEALAREILAEVQEGVPQEALTVVIVVVETGAAEVVETAAVTEEDDLPEILIVAD